MSDDSSRFKNSKRRLRDDNAVVRQVKIAKQHGLDPNNKSLTEPHRHVKLHAMDCGNPKCMLCGNPRRNPWYKKNRLTTQERRLFQDTEITRDKHSNGISTPKTD
jgi:hypothetical protein